MSESSDARIPLHVSNSKAFVWSVEDVKALRAVHHICGVLVGTLPHASQQNVFLGLPLVLMPEEVFVLVRNRHAYIVDDNASHETPTEEQLIQWNETRRQALAKVPPKTPSFVPPTLSDEAIRKRAERQKRKEELALSAAAASLNSPATEAPPSSVDLKPGSSKENSYAFTIPGASEFPWYTEKRYDTIEGARAANVWTYPATPEEDARCRVFEDLWKQGYFMGNALRFGGDWLVYPGECRSPRTARLLT